MGQVSGTSIPHTASPAGVIIAQMKRKKAPHLSPPPTFKIRSRSAFLHPIILATLPHTVGFLDSRTNVVPCNHDTFHFDWQELLLGIKARYYLSCPVRQGLTGVTFSLVRQEASIHYPVGSELAAGTDCCLSAEALCPISCLSHVYTQE